MKRAGIWIVAIAVLALVVWAVPSLRHGVADLLGTSHETISAESYYTCPMHPQIRLTQPGDCPICGMSLVLKTGGGDARAGAISVTPRQLQLTGVTTEPVSRRSLARAINAYGTVDYDETHLAVVSAWVGGRIDKLYIDFTGVTVDKGHPLVDLYSPDLLAASEEHALAVENLERARGVGRADAIRAAEDLVAASRQRLHRWGLTEAQIESMGRRGASASEDHITMYAPQGGTVIERMAYEGMYVEQGDVLFRVADLSSVWLNAEVYEDDIPYLYQQRAGDYFVCPMHAEVTSKGPRTCPKCGMDLIRTNDDVSVQITARAFPGEVFEGKVAFTNPVLNAETRTVRVRVNIANTDYRLKPNMVATASIHLPVGEMIAVPENAVLQSGSRSVVLVEEAPGTFRPQIVTLGRMWLDEAAPSPVAAAAERARLPFKREATRYHEVVAGLDGGERVVTSGNFLVGSESQLQGALAKMLEIEATPVDTASAPGGEVSAPQARIPVPESTLDVVRATRVLDAYHRIVTALAADKLDGVGAAAAAIEAGAPTTDIAAAARPLMHAEHGADIAAARTHLLALSDAMIAFVASNRAALARSLDPASLPRTAHCPMYPGSWLQRGDEILNPYYGSRMLHCGTFQ